MSYVMCLESACKSNDAQILTMGAKVIGPELAKSVADAWLRSEFQGGGSTEKVARIAEYERKHPKKQHRRAGRPK